MSLPIFKHQKLPLALLLCSATLPISSLAKDVDFSDPLTELNSALWWKSDGWSNGFPFTNSWEGEAISFSDAGMALSLAPTNYADTGYPYQSGEFRSQGFYGYGCFEIEMKPVAKSGVVSSFFLFAGPYDKPEKGNGKHNEIDIEFLGKDTSMVQINFWTNDDRYELAHEHIIPLGFDAAEAFHRYGIEWRRKSISWYVDGQLVHQVKHDASDPIPQVSSSKLRVMANLWATDNRISDWAGYFEAGDFPITAHYRNASFKSRSTCKSDE